MLNDGLAVSTFHALRVVTGYVEQCGIDLCYSRALTKHVWPGKYAILERQTVKTYGRVETLETGIFYIL